MTKFKISKILRDAADYYLSDLNMTKLSDASELISWEYSCVAITQSLYASGMGDPNFDSKIRGQMYLDIIEGLEAMGLNNILGDAFQDIHDRHERQGARYMWLKLAALMAEEQGQ